MFPYSALGILHIVTIRLRRNGVCSRCRDNSRARAEVYGWQFSPTEDLVALVRKIASCALGLLLTASCGRQDDVRPAEWDYISGAIFQTNCSTGSCHNRAAAAAGLDFSDPDRGYTSLTKLWVWIVDPNATGPGCRPNKGTDICERGDRPLVTPYSPSQSRLVNSLRARGSSRMPPDRPLTEADIELVERWILNGAFKEPAIIRARKGEADAGVDASTMPLPNMATPAVDAGGGD